MSGPSLSRVICACALCTSRMVGAQVVEQPDRFGNVARIALPAAVALYSFSRDDIEGVGQLSLAWGSSVLATEAINRATHEPRPTGTGRGTVSSHAAGVFAAAGYVHRRYGFQPAVPAYVIATVTAYGRVHNNHHFTRQVVKGAAVGLGSAYLLARPLPGGGYLGMLPASRGIALEYAIRW